VILKPPYAVSRVRGGFGVSQKRSFGRDASLRLDTPERFIGRKFELCDLRLIQWYLLHEPRSFA